MGSWTFDEICKTVSGSWIVEPVASSEVPMGASIDTRELKAGQVFFAFDGEQVDGHGYISNAIERGAAMVVVTNPDSVDSDCSVPVLCVKDAERALTQLAELWRAKISARVVAVTGSNGKTTTCRMIDTVLAEYGRGSVSQKSFNNQLGVPITVLNAKPDDEYLICELGTSSPGEIAARTALCKPDISVIVSIGRAHLEELGSRDGVSAEKASIANGAAVVIMPGEIEGLERAVRSQNPSEVLVVDEPVEIGMLGEHNKFNAALAAAVGGVFKMDERSIGLGLSRATTPAMRLERSVVITDGEAIEVLNDAYNANPDSMRASLRVLSGFESRGRRVAVLGDMLELGSKTDREHRDLVAEIEQCDDLDLVLCIGKAFAAVGSSGRVQMIAGTDDAAFERIASMIEPGDAVLLKGSRSMRVERVLTALKHRFEE